VRLSDEELERWRDAAYVARLDVASFVRGPVEEGIARRELEREEAQVEAPADWLPRLEQLSASIR
jgi:hypothetical protein